MLYASKLLLFVATAFAICGASPASPQQSTCAAEGGSCGTGDNPSFIQKPLAKDVSLTVSQGRALKCKRKDVCNKVALTKTDPEARCNDNTKAFFYYAPAKDPASKTWFIYQRGGDWCYDQNSCSGRSPELMSSAAWPEIESFPKGSFLNYDGSFEAHRVYLPYCTSDGYIGNYTAGSMQFRGRVVTQALFETLHVKYGLGEGATVVHGGCSAGGRGVMHNVNHVLKQLKSYGEIRYIPVLDSALYVRAHDGLSEYDMAKEVYKRTPKSVDSKCKQIYKPKQWRCLIAEFALPTVDTTFVTQAYLFDLFQTSWKGRGCSGSPQDSYCTWFQAHSRALARAYKEAGNAVLAPACSAHCSIQSAAFSEFKTDGVSFADIVDKAVGGQTGSAIDLCALPQCNLGFAGEGSLQKDKCKQTETVEMQEDVYSSGQACSLQSTGRQGRQFGSGFVCEAAE